MHPSVMLEQTDNQAQHLEQFLIERSTTHLSYTAQVISLQIVAVFWGPGCVAVALVLLYNVLSWHGDGRQI